MRQVVIHLILVCLTAAGAMGLSGGGAIPANVPASGPADIAPAATSMPAASRPTASAPAIDEAVMKLLKAQAAASEASATIRADVHYLLTDKLMGETKTRTGWVAYQRGTAKAPSMFRIHFKDLKENRGPTYVQKLDYAFDGEYFVSARHRLKKINRYRLSSRGKVEPMRLGKGPFPLPFGQSVADVLKYFKPTTRKRIKDDPPNTDYLKLTILPARVKEMPFTTLELWLDSTTHLPAQSRSVDKSRKVKTVRFTKVKAGEKFDKDTFVLPARAGWQVTTRMLDSAGADIVKP